MPNFTAGTSFQDGVTNDVTALKLNALVADAVPTSSLALTSTNGTIANFTSSTANITLGTIPTLTAGTTTGTAGIFTSGTIPTGTFGTTTSTAATITTGTIGTLVSTGTITGSTNVVNIGSGQIYKDASGNVGIGVTSPSSKLTVGSGDILISDNFGIGAGGGAQGIYNGTSQFVRFDTASAERMRIDSSGNVGIGTGGTAAAGKLDVYGLGYFQGLEIGKSGQTGNRVAGIDFIGDDFYGDYGFRIIRQSTGSNADTYLTNRGTGNLVLESVEAGQVLINTSQVTRLTIASGGGVTIAGLAGTGSRAVNASAAGLLSAASDASLKEEVAGAHIAGLAEILQIHPKMYRWKDDIANRGENASVELGFIANDVAPIIPSAAPLGNDGLYGFYDRSITAALVKAVQELKSENDSLKSRIEALEAK